MSAFYDIWISNNKDEVPKECRVADELWQEQSYANTRYFISKPQTSTFYSVCESDEYRLVVFGQFYEAVVLDALLDAYVKYIEGSSSNLNESAGHYIILIIARRSGHVHIFTNSFGTYHAYWLAENGRNVISTYFLGLARSSAVKKLDWEGLTGFFGMGYFPLDKTYFESIKIFLPASHYHFDEHLALVSSRKYRSWQAGNLLSDPKQALASMHEVLSSSIAESTKAYNVALPLSGGLDSRTIAGVFSNNNDAKSAWSFSYGYTKKSKEIQIAGQIAQVCSMSFNGYVVPNYLFKQQDLIANSVELFQYIDGTRQAMMAEELKQRSDVVIGGHWGDVWLNDVAVNSKQTLQDIFNKKIVKKGSNWLLSEIVSKHAAGNKDFLCDYYNTAINKYSGLSNNLKFKAYKTDEWSFRWTLASIRMYQAGSFPILPFYDKNVADVLFNIAPELLVGRKLQVEYLKRFHPKLAAIKWQEYNSDLYNYKWLNNRNYAYRAAKKMQRVLANERPITRNWEVFYLNTEGKIALEKKLLNNKTLTQILTADKIRELISVFYGNPSAANGYTISMLHTFAQFLERVYE